MPDSVKTLAPLALARIFLISLVFTVVTHPGLWLAMARGYAGDYLFNLSPLQIAGLIFITSILGLLLFLACTTSSYLFTKWSGKYLTRWTVVLAAMVLALFLCAIALLLVPQLHYQYYRLIIPDLPVQWVPLGDLSGKVLWQYLLLSADATTTIHAKGATVWICICASALVAFRTTRLA